MQIPLINSNLKTILFASALFLLFVALPIYLIFPLGEFWNFPCHIKGICIAYTFFAIVSLIFFVKYYRAGKNNKSRGLTALICLIFFFLLAGAIAYAIVFHTFATDSVRPCDSKPEFNFGEILLRPIIASAELFVFNVDTNILDRLDAHPGLKAWLVIDAYACFACTIYILADLVLARLWASFKLWRASKSNSKCNHLYIFFGDNEPSKLLATQIRDNDSEAKILIVDVANIDDNEHDERNKIVNFLAHKPRVFDNLKFKNTLVAVSSEEPADANVSERSDVFETIGLENVKAIIENLTKTDSPQLHIFFMSDDEERNIRNILALAKDALLTDIAATYYDAHKNLLKVEKAFEKLESNRSGSAQNIPETIASNFIINIFKAAKLILENQIQKYPVPKFYCHARYNGPNRVIEDLAFNKHFDLNIVDSSHLAVEQLKSNPEFHPIKVASLSPINPGTVDEPFNSLIIGFGEVGRDAFRFLWEFAAFVDADATDTHARRSPFSCTIVDSNLDNIRGSFCAMMPAIFPPDGRAPKNIFFRSIDYNHSDFYTRILTEDFLRKLNYVVISIGDNDEAIALGARIFTLARRAGADLSKLRIMVRCTDNAKVEMKKKITDHYNLGYGKTSDKQQSVIDLFGMPEEIYTYKLIVKKELIEQAKKYNEKYSKVCNTPEKDIVSWDKRRDNATEAKPASIDKLRKLRRQESQDIANALHAFTKLHLLRTALDKNTAKAKNYWEQFLARLFDGDHHRMVGTTTKIHFTELDDEENKIMHRLAQLEHIRWNAAHEIMGYISNPGSPWCDETHMTHGCIRPWEEIDTASDQSEKAGDRQEYKNFDFSVVTTSIYLHPEKLTNPEENTQNPQN